MSSCFFNTTKETGEELAKGKAKATTQEEVILKVFIDRKQLSPSDIKDIFAGSFWNIEGDMSYHMFKDVPLTSIRARITNLTKKGKLIKTDKKKLGRYDRNEYIWKLIEPEDRQLELL